MKEIKEIVRIYDKLFVNNTTKILRSSFNEKEEALFDFYHTDLSENSISKKIYNTSPSHQSFQSLKQSLRDKLYLIVLSAKIPNYFQSQRVNISKEWLVIKTLNAFQLRSIAIPISEKLLRKCLKFQMYNEAFELSRNLVDHYAVFVKKPKKAEAFYNTANHCAMLLQKELEYAYLYQTYRSYYGTPKFADSVGEFRKTADELKSLMYLNDNRLLFYYYELRFFEYYILKDYDKLVETCQEALKAFENLPFRHNTIIDIFTFHLIEVHLTFNALEEAKSMIGKYLDKADKKSSAYYRYKELLFRILLFQGAFDEARSVMAYLRKNIRRLSNIFTRDRLLIYEMYIALYENKKINFRKINYNLNKVKQDKRGLHVPYLIAQAIYYYLNDQDKLYEKIDSLNQYAYKYLKGDEFARTRQFIKILNKILFDKDYDITTLEESAKTITNYGLEMVSYEILVDFLVTRTKVVAV